MNATVVHAHPRASNEVRPRVRDLYDAVPGAVVTFDADGLIITSNATLCRILGYEEGALCGQPVVAIWPTAQASVVECSEIGELRCEAEWKARTGETIPVMASLATQCDAHGSIESYVCVALDLSDRRMHEVELRHAHKLESLGQLAAGIAHEINTPMQFIGDNLAFVHDVLSTGGVPEIEPRDTLLRALSAAREGVSRVARIVEAMRAVSHSRSRTGPFDINKCLRDTLTVAHHQYRYVARIEANYGSLPPVLCNAGDMSQVFLNLVVNAAQAIEAKYGKDNGIRGVIRVRTRCEGDDVVVSIGDDGVGIAPAIQHRIFDPFFTTKEVGHGTGQGLSISRAIVVDRHGGSLTFESEPGQGATFHVRIPITGRDPDKTAATPTERFP
jgi:two-component system NtrC family sensor kinase